MECPIYVPIEDAPLRMVPSLARFGTDYGNGAQDRAYFQVDRRYAEYVAQKRLAPSHRRFVVGDDALARAARAEALGWMRRTIAREHPEIARSSEADAEAEDAFDALARHVQEDFAVLQAGADDRGRTLVVDVRFPSGWHPERLREADFAEVHDSVPGFPASGRAAQGMVRAMVDRGPYVRFVWTVCTDPSLDQHPERAGEPRGRWPEAREVHLRVERQVSVPLPRTRSSVFLVRVSMTPLAALEEAQRARVVRAVRVMPPEVRAYKGLPEAALFEAALARSLEEARPFTSTR